MMHVPNPLGEYAPAQFRLAGFGGAGVFLRSQVVPAKTFGSDHPSLAFDVMLLAPDWHVWHMSRPVMPGFVDRLSTFLFEVANHFVPEQSVDAFTDAAMGLTISVESSEEGRVELAVTVVREPGADVPEVDDLNFETSRATLVSASFAVRGLDSSWDAEQAEELPS